MKIDNLKLTCALMIAGILCGLLLLQNGLLITSVTAIVYVASIPFMVTAIVELNNSDRIDKKEKTMWTFGFVALTFITAILYFTSERKRVLQSQD